MGHIGAALVAKSAEPRLNLGAALAAALLPDFLLWALVILGYEAILGAHLSGSARYFTFSFPYSHGLIASVAWSGVAASAVAGLWPRGSSGRGRVASIVALAVLSHVLLDVVVHVPDVPVAGPGSARIGFGLWRHMPVALGLELVLTSGALGLYGWSRRPARRQAIVVATTCAVAAILTAIGPYAPGPPPTPVVVSASSLATLLVVVGIGFAAEGRVGVTARASETSPARRMLSSER